MKTVKINDFDWDGFRRSEFCIVSDSSQNLLAVLQALSEKGYYWGISGTSLIEDSVIKDQLLDDIKQELIYIRAGGLLHGVICDYTDRRYAVTIDFNEEDKNMKEIKRVKAKDFDSEAFRRKEFRIVIRTYKNASRTLRFLHEKGYVWGNSKTSLLEDDHIGKRLLEETRCYPVFIIAGGTVRNGVLCDSISSYIIPTVELDFEEDKNMNVTEIKKVKAKDFDWAAFKRKKFRIAIPDIRSIPRILQFLHEKGFKWGFSKTSLLEDARMRELLSDAALRRTVFIESGGFISNGVLHDCSYLSDIPTVELVFEEETKNDKIVITNDGKTTTATLYSNGKKAGIGTAICHDDDKFDVYAGARLALERLEKNKKEAEMSDWEKFVKGTVNMRVPKKYIRNFLDRARNDGLTFKGTMSDWYLRWLMQYGDSIVFSVDCDIEKTPIIVEVINGDWGRTVDYIPGMK